MFLIVTLEPVDEAILGYLFIYMYPLITNDYSIKNWWAWIVVLSFICIVVAKSYGNQFNPVLAIFGWHYYKVTDCGGRTSLLISKSKNVRYRTNDVLSVAKITDYVLIDRSVS